MKKKFLLIILLIPFLCEAQKNSDFKGCAKRTIEFLGGIELDFGDGSEKKEEKERHPSVQFKRVLTEGKQTDSVDVRIYAYPKSKILKVNELHTLNGNEMNSYFYSIDTNGAIISAYTQKPGNKDDHFNEIDVTKAPPSKTLNDIYLWRAREVVCQFINKTEEEIEENNKPRKSGVMIAGKTFGEIKKADFLKQESLLLTDDLKKDLRITSFYFVVMDKNFKSFKNKDGAEFTDEMREAIKNGDDLIHVSIPNTFCVNKNDSIIELPNQNFILK